jgi:hypothetical protein
MKDYFCFYLSIQVLSSICVCIGCVLIFCVLFWLFWRSHRGADFIYFDAKDAEHFIKDGSRVFPLAARDVTFAPMLKNYIGVTKLLITVSAASITFGGNTDASLIVHVAKTVLAWGILYGVLFCAILLYRYDEYTQDVRSYTRRWYSLVETLGFSGLACFVLGYFVWAFRL